MSVLLLLAVIVSGCGSGPPKPVGDPDPGGASVAALEQAVADAAMGYDIRGTGVDASHWDSCDGERSTYGWTHAGVHDVLHPSPDAFSSRSQYLKQVDASLASQGWTEGSHRSSHQHWTLSLSDGAHVRFDLIYKGPGEIWRLAGNAAPLARKVSGC